MIVVVNHIKAGDKESFNKIVNMFKSRAGLVDKFDGFQGFKLLASSEDREIMVMTFWRDKEAFRKWVESREFREGHKRTEAVGINAESRGVVYDIIIE